MTKIQDFKNETGSNHIYLKRTGEFANTGCAIAISKKNYEKFSSFFDDFDLSSRKDFLSNKYSKNSMCKNLDMTAENIDIYKSNQDANVFADEKGTCYHF